MFVLATKLPLADLLHRHRTLPESEAGVLVVRDGGSATPQTVLANSRIQFEQYHCETFQWLLVNAMGYTVQFAASYEVEAA